MEAWQQWEVEKAERRRVQAQKESRDQILGIIEQWALASRIESFFESVAAKASGLQDEERTAILQRLERARALFGGPDAMGWFQKWKLPEER